MWSQVIKWGLRYTPGICWSLRNNLRLCLFSKLLQYASSFSSLSLSFFVLCSPFSFCSDLLTVFSLLQISEVKQKPVKLITATNTTATYETTTSQQPRNCSAGKFPFSYGSCSFSYVVAATCVSCIISPWMYQRMLRMSIATTRDRRSTNLKQPLQFLSTHFRQIEYSPYTEPPSPKLAPKMQRPFVISIAVTFAGYIVEINNCAIQVNTADLVAL